MRPRRRFPQALAALPMVLALALVTVGAQSWTPPSGGAVEMFRQAERVFTVGARSGGAGSGGAGGGTASTGASAEPVPTERTMAFELVPIERWDDPRGPVGHGVREGRVLLYLRGEYVPRFEAGAGEDVALPAGTWFAVGESPGGVTTFSSPIRVSPGESGSGDLVLPLAPACRVRWSGEGWTQVERVDVVSLAEGAVFPLVPGQAGPSWIPAGPSLAYAVADDEIVGLGAVESCEPGEPWTLSVPKSPAPDRQALVVRISAPRKARDRVSVLVTPRTEGREVHAIGSAWIGASGFFFFPELPASELRVRVETGSGPPVEWILPAAGGTVRTTEAGSPTPAPSTSPSGA